MLADLTEGRHTEPRSSRGDARRISRWDVTRVTSKLLSDLQIHDITIADPPIESVIEQAFNQ
jgi:ABC-type uncharacterized transport system ATPase subunit